MCCARPWLVVFKAKFASIFTDDCDVLPSKSVKSLSSDLAQGWRKVHEINTRKELGNIDEATHGLNVPARPASNLSTSVNVSIINENCIVIYAVTHVNPNPLVLVSSDRHSLLGLRLELGSN